jgi:transposase
MRRVKADRFAGVDVAKARLDVRIVPGEKYFMERNDEAGTRRVASRLKRLGVQLTVLEATGGYECRLASELELAGLPAAVVNPRNTRDFARSQGLLAKTDKLDAGVLAMYAERMKPEPTRPKSREELEYSSLVSRRRQLVLDRAREKTRLEKTIFEWERESVAAHIKWLDEQITQIEGKISERIKQDSEMNKRNRLLRSVPGVGPVASATLMASLPELGGLGRNQISALAGLAPLNNDSGNRRGRRSVWGGRSDVRCALYMAAVAAIVCNPVIKVFYDRLRGSGKGGKVAVTACARKLLVILNAMVRDGSAWNEKLMREVHAIAS